MNVDEKREAERLLAAIFYRPPSRRAGAMLLELCATLHGGPDDGDPMHECLIGRLGVRLDERGDRVTQRWLARRPSRRSRVWLDPTVYRSMTTRSR